jgi:hypothetical protein
MWVSTVRELRKSFSVISGLVRRWHSRARTSRSRRMRFEGIGKPGWLLHGFHTGVRRQHGERIRLGIHPKHLASDIVRDAESVLTQHSTRTSGDALYVKSVSNAANAGPSSLRLDSAETPRRPRRLLLRQWSSSASGADGDSILHRTAASSMARGSPSSRQPLSDTDPTLVSIHEVGH